mgnify:FL=1|jgi:hypothetical protein|tara:strand:- start:500 stop:730 length:231 start_codon:yes stop_codon:yes gene_type:complete
MYAQIRALVLDSLWSRHFLKTCSARGRDEDQRKFFFRFAEGNKETTSSRARRAASLRELRAASERFRSTNIINEPV